MPPTDHRQPAPSRTPSGPSFQRGGSSGNRWHRRYVLLYGLFVGLGLILIGRLFFLQFVDAAHLRQEAQKSRNQSIARLHRGRILDRKGTILAQDTILYDLYAHPRFYHEARPEQLAEALAPVLGISSGSLYHQLAEPIPTITLVKNLTRKTKETIDHLRLTIPRLNPKTNEAMVSADGQPLTRTIPLTGLDFFKKRVRNYPQGELASHVLGYVNDEAELAYGVEESAKLQLAKAPVDTEVSLLNGKGDYVHPEDMKPEQLVQSPEAEDVTLTIDSRLQYICENALKIGLEKSKAPRGTAIMMDPKSGEVLAYAVLPEYSPERYFRYPGQTVKNWTLSDVYPPGSTIKILTLATGLETGVINQDSTILDTGKMTIGGWHIQNYDYGKHGAPGNINLVYLLQHSSNIGSAKIAMMIPAEKHRAQLQLFGFGKKTGIDLPGESAGILKPLSDWDLSTHASIGYGYGLASTPVQMMGAVASIANGGQWVTPHVIKKNPVIEHRQVLSPKTCQAITDLLVESINNNPESTVKLSGFEVAGKTGTSRKPKEGHSGYDNNLFTSFVGYFPARNPKLLVMVVVDSPKMAEAWGSTVAGPIFKQIATEAINYLGMKPNPALMITPSKASFSSVHSSATRL